MGARSEAAGTRPARERRLHPNRARSRGGRHIRATDLLRRRLAPDAAAAILLARILEVALVTHVAARSPGLPGFHLRGPAGSPGSTASGTSAPRCQSAHCLGPTWTRAASPGDGRNAGTDAARRAAPSAAAPDRAASASPGCARPRRGAHSIAPPPFSPRLRRPRRSGRRAARRDDPPRRAPHRRRLEEMQNRLVLGQERRPDVPHPGGELGGSPRPRRRLGNRDGRRVRLDEVARHRLSRCSAGARVLPRHGAAPAAHGHRTFRSAATQKSFPAPPSATSVPGPPSTRSPPPEPFRRSFPAWPERRFGLRHPSGRRRNGASPDRFPAASSVPYPSPSGDRDPPSPIGRIVEPRCRARAALSSSFPTPPTRMSIPAPPVSLSLPGPPSSWFPTPRPRGARPRRHRRRARRSRPRSIQSPPAPPTITSSPAVPLSTSSAPVPEIVAVRPKHSVAAGSRLRRRTAPTLRALPPPARRAWRRPPQVPGVRSWPDREWEPVDGETRPRVGVGPRRALRPLRRRSRSHRSGPYPASAHSFDAWKLPASCSGFFSVHVDHLSISSRVDQSANHESLLEKWS